MTFQKMKVIAGVISVNCVAIKSRRDKSGSATTAMNRSEVTLQPICFGIINIMNIYGVNEVQICVVRCVTFLFLQT